MTTTNTYELHVTDTDGKDYGTETFTGTEETVVDEVKSALAFANAITSTVFNGEYTSETLGMKFDLFRVEGDNRTQVFWDTNAPSAS